MPLSNDAIPFSRTEYATRIAKTRRVMEERGIDLLIATDPSNMAWLTGYDGWSFYVHQCVIFTLDEDSIWYGHQQDVNGAKRTVFMDDARLEFYPDHYVQSTERHPMQHLAGIIEARGWQRCRIGVEMENYYSAAGHVALLDKLPNA